MSASGRPAAPSTVPPAAQSSSRQQLHLVPPSAPWPAPAPARAARSSKLRTRLAYFAGDFVLINAGFLLAYWLRYDLRLWPEQSEFFDAPLSSYYLAQALLVGVLLIDFARRGLYRLKRTTAWLDEVGTIVSGTTVGISVLVMVFYVFRPGVTSRAMLFYAWVAIIVFLSAVRLAVRSVVAH